MTTCRQCGKPFKPAKSYFHTCPVCWNTRAHGRGRRELVACRATTSTGRACRAWAAEGSLFCVAHLKQGYGLFELAVRRRVS